MSGASSYDTRRDPRLRCRPLATVEGDESREKPCPPEHLEALVNRGARPLWDGRDAAEWALTARERAAWLLFIGSLPHAQLQALFLVGKGLSQREAAEMVGISRNALRATMRKAQRWMARHGTTPERTAA